jgi:hypothetical protein
MFSRFDADRKALPMIIKPITSEIGATVEVAAEAVLVNEAAQQLRAALDRYNVLIFPAGADERRHIPRADRCAWRET